jgi:hypothetical protein
MDKFSRAVAYKSMVFVRPSHDFGLSEHHLLSGSSCQMVEFEITRRRAVQDRPTGRASVYDRAVLGRRPVKDVWFITKAIADNCCGKQESNFEFEVAHSISVIGR